jgi:hypothetical protein
MGQGFVVRLADEYQRALDAKLKELQDGVDLRLGRSTRKSRHNEVDVIKAKGIAMGVDMAAKLVLSVSPYDFGKGK